MGALGAARAAKLKGLCRGEACFSVGLLGSSTSPPRYTLRFQPGRAFLLPILEDR